MVPGPPGAPRVTKQTRRDRQKKLLSTHLLHPARCRCATQPPAAIAAHTSLLPSCLRPAPCPEAVSVGSRAFQSRSTCDVLRPGGTGGTTESEKREHVSLACVSLSRLTPR